MKQTNLLALILLLIGSCSICHSDVTINPIGIAVFLDHEDNDSLTSTITLSNRSEDVISYQIEFAGAIPPPNEPFSFQGPNQENQYCSPIGWDWDNEWMWITCCNTGEVSAWSHNADYDEFEQQAEFNLDACLDGAWLDGILYIFSYDNRNALQRIDVEGNQLEEIDFGFNCSGVAADVQQGWLLVLENGRWRIHVYSTEDGEIDEEIGIIEIPDPYGEFIAYNLEWVPAHWENGQLWINAYRNRLVCQFVVDIEEWELLEIASSIQTQLSQPWDAVAHDGHNLWAGGYSNDNVRIYHDGYNEELIPGMSITPMRGIVEVNEEAEIELVLTSTDLPSGTYTSDFFFVIEGLEQINIEFTVILTVDEDVANITGFITDAATEEVVVGAFIQTERFAYGRMSDEEGLYGLPNLPLGDYRITASARDYLPQTTAISLEESIDYELDFALLHAELELGPDSISASVQEGDSSQFEIEANNPGNGPLTITIREESAPNEVEWMCFTPDSGIIQPDSTLMITLTLRAFVLPETTYTGELIFEHDGIGGRTVLPVTMEVIPLSIDGSGDATPLESTLLDAYPSPFNSSTTLAFSISNNENIKLVVFDIYGREVAQVMNKRMNAGRHTVTFDGGDLTGGVYFARLMSSGNTQTLKMVLLK